VPGSPTCYPPITHCLTCSRKASGPWLAVLVGSLQIEINVLLFVSFLKPDTPFGALTPSSLRFGTMTLALLSLGLHFPSFESLAQRETAVPSVSGRR
jgi:hypothetical protein